MTDHSPQSTETFLKQFRELIDRAWALQRSDPEAMVSVGKEALDALPHESLSDRENGLHMAEALRVMGRGNILTKKLPEAVNQIQKALALCRAFEDENAVVVTLNTLATAYSAMSLHEPALNSFFEVVKSPHGSKHLIANASMNIAGVYAKIGHMDRALQYFQDGIHGFEQDKQFASLSMVLSNLSAVYYELEENEKAENTAHQALALVDKHDLGPSYFLHAACNLVATYLRLDRYDEARALSEKIREQLKTENNHWTELTLNMDFGEYYVRVGQHSKAQDLLRSALDLNPELSDECKIQSFLARSYKAEGDFEKALHHFENYHKLHEILFNKESDLRAQTLESQHRLDKIQRELSLARAQNAKLLKEVEAKSAYLRDVTHDVNSPLGAILGFTELLKSDPDLNLQHQEFIEAINKSGKFILALTKSLQQSSTTSSDSSSLRRDRILWETLLKDLTEPLTAEAQLKGLKLHVANHIPKSFQFHSDSEKIQRILRNLLGNALKFTKQGSITITAQLSEDFRILTVDVEDTGPGIPEELLESLFEAFHQGPEARESGQGRGLGLAICRQFAKDLGATVNAESQLGQGSRFSLRLPLGSP